MNDHARDANHRDRPEAGTQYVLRQEDEEHQPEPVNGTEVQANAYATVVAETPTEIARLSVSDAVMRMDLAHQPVLMFRNITTEELNVVYRRSDGHIGWIDPTASG